MTAQKFADSLKVSATLVHGEVALTEESWDKAVHALTSLANRDDIWVRRAERTSRTEWAVSLTRVSQTHGQVATQTWRVPCLDAHHNPDVEPYMPGVGMVLAYWLYYVASFEGRHANAIDFDVTALQQDMWLLLEQNYEDYMQAAGYPQVDSGSGGCVVLLAAMTSAAAVISHLAGWPTT
jgi:hypothetical protein